MNNEWMVSGWKNGGRQARRISLGVRIGKKLRSEILSGTPSSVRFRLPDGSEFDAAVAESFWRSCPEIRHRAIGVWLKSLNLAQWPRGEPPRFLLRRIAPNHFLLTLPLAG